MGDKNPKQKERAKQQKSDSDKRKQDAHDKKQAPPSTPGKK